jgi:hypothetical protein
MSNLSFLIEALKAANKGRPLPSLLNPGKTLPQEFIEMAAQKDRLTAAAQVLINAESALKK